MKKEKSLRKENTFSKQKNFLDYLKKKRSNKIIFLSLLFLVIALLSIVFSHHIPLSLEKYLYYLFSFAIFLFFLKIGQKFSKIELFIDYLLIMLLILNLLVIFLTTFNVSSTYFQGMNLLIRSYGHNHYAAFLLLILPVIWWRILHTSKSYLFNKKFKIYLEVFLLLSSYLLVLLSVSRLGLLIAILQFIIIFLLNKSNFIKIRRKKILYSLVKSLIFLFICLSFIFIFLSFPLSSDNEQNCLLKIYRKDLCVSITKNSRLYYWRQAWLTFRNYPFFGYGLDTFRHVAYRFPIAYEQHSAYAHNIFLHNLAEMGMIGGGLFILLIFYIYYQSFLVIKKSKKDINYFLYLGTLSSLINAMFDFDWHFFVIFLLTLIYLAYILSNEEEQIIEEINYRFWQVFTFFLLIIGSFFLISNALTIHWQKTKPEHWLRHTSFFNIAVNVPYTKSVETLDNYKSLYNLYRYDTNFIFRFLNFNGELDYQLKKILYLNLAEINPAGFVSAINFRDWNLEESRLFLERLIEIIEVNNFFGSEYFINYWQRMDLAQQVFNLGQEAYKLKEWENASYFYHQALFFDEYVFFTEPALFLTEDDLNHFLGFSAIFTNISPHVVGDFDRYIGLYKENTTKLFLANCLDEFKNLITNLLDEEKNIKPLLINHLYDLAENNEQLLVLEEIETNY